MISSASMDGRGAGKMVVVVEDAEEDWDISIDPSGISLQNVFSRRNEYFK